MHWYAVRVTYSRELFFKDYLDAEGIENYIPMRYEYVVRKERRLRKLVPAVHNLVFVRSTRERMDEIKNEPGMNIPIRYIMDRETRQPIVIPDSQMRSFIAVSGTYDQAVLYLEPTAITPSMFTTTLLSWRTRTNTPSTPSKMPPVIRTRVPWERFSSVGSR